MKGNRKNRIMKSVLSLILVLSMCLPTGATLCANPETVPGTAAQEPTAVTPPVDTPSQPADDTTAAPSDNAVTTISETPAGGTPEGNADVGDTAEPPAAPEPPAGDTAPQTPANPSGEGTTPETPAAPGDGTTPQTPATPSDGETPETPATPGDGTTTPETEEVPDSDTPTTNTPTGGAETPAEPEKTCTCTPSEDGTHLEGCPLYQAPTEPEKTCTCTPNPDGTHLVGCPMYVAPTPAAPAVETVTLTDTDAATGTQVTVTGPFPQGSYVKITQVAMPEVIQVMMLSETSEPPETIAYDVTIYDAAGSEIEPDGTATVTFKLGAAVPIDAAAAGSLSVIHLKEDQNGEVEDMIDTGAEASVAGDQTVEATFTTDSFSTFVITWTGNYGWEYFKITVHYVNTLGGEIDDSKIHHADGTISAGNTVTFAAGEEYTPTGIEGLTYQEARLGNAANGDKITHMTASKRLLSVSFYNGNKSVETFTYEGYGPAKEIDVYLIYKEGQVSPPAIPEMPTIDHHKTVERNSDGTYNLTLDVTGAATATSGKKKLDVLMIVDFSTSMNYGMGGQGKPGPSRYEHVKTAVKNLTDSLSGNTNLDVMYDVEVFWGSAEHLVGWTSSANEVNTEIENQRRQSGTNYYAGIERGIKALVSSRPDAEKIVIFLTDGRPNTPTNETNAMNRAVEAIQNLSCNQFYAIGVGSSFSNPSSTAVNNLQRLCDSVGTATDENVTKPADPMLYSATDTEELETAFATIAGNAQKFFVSNVAITDILSQNVTLVPSAPGAAPTGDDLTITVKKADGTQVVTGKDNVTLPATDTNETGTTVTATVTGSEIKLNFVPATYQLEEGWTYSVTAKIKPTDAAYNAFITDGKYPDKGDPGTGDYAGQDGLFTNVNESAKVDYIFNGETASVPYDKPVIQVTPLVIEKTITGLTPEQEASLRQKLSFDVTVNQGTPKNYKLSDFTHDQTTGKYTLVVKDLPLDATYQVAEKDAKVEGYTVTTTKNGESGTITGATLAKATFTNAYQEDLGNLRITKTFDGLDADKVAKVLETLTFTVVDKEGTETAKVEGKALTRVSENGSSYTCTIPNLPVGEYTVTESGAELTGYTFITDYTMPSAPGSASVAVKVEKADSQDDATFVAVKNTYTPNRLTITKVLESFNKDMGDDATFLFEVKNNATGAVYYRMVNFTKKGDKAATIEGIPAGTYTVTELPVAGYEAIGETTQTVTVDSTGEVSFTNKATDGPHGDSANAKNVLQYVEGTGWVAEQSEDSHTT